jgi:GMP synthase-like glutamine amidotransferase
MNPLGGTVIRAGRPEIGWTTVQTSRPDLIEPGPWFQWHADRWVTTFLALGGSA